MESFKRLGVASKSWGAVGVVKLSLGALPVTCRLEKVLNSLQQNNLMKTNQTGYRALLQPFDEQAHRTWDNAHFLYEAIVGFDLERPKQCKLVLTGNVLVISEPVDEAAWSISYARFNFDLKFARIAAPLSSGLPLIGFSIHRDGAFLNIYPQHPQETIQIVTILGSHLNELNIRNFYNPVGKLGKGSSAAVFQVVRLSDGVKFAAKAFSKKILEKNLQQKRSVINEIILLRKLRDRGIILLEGVFQSSNSIYIITEEMTGGSLCDLLRAKLPSLDTSRVLLAKMLQGLAYIHSEGILHRDIKLENVMLRRKGTLSPVIIDFGLAVKASAADQTINYRCGTPGYLAPEVLETKIRQEITSKCDIFSLGVIFHALLTGKLLFEGTSVKEIFQNNKMMKFDLSSQQYDWIDASALDLLGKMLAADPLKRISAQQALSHLFFEQPKKDASQPNFSRASTLTSIEEEFSN